MRNVISNREAGERVRARRTFRNSTSSLAGVDSYQGSGRLPERFRRMSSLCNADYVVYSYATPIAWYYGGRWFIPETRYSITTTSHQSEVNAGLRDLPRRRIVRMDEPAKRVRKRKAAA